jgi:hypothetical protein
MVSSSLLEAISSFGTRGLFWFPCSCFSHYLFEDSCCNQPTGRQVGLMSNRRIQNSNFKQNYLKKLLIRFQLQHKTTTFVRNDEQKFFAPMFSFYLFCYNLNFIV